MLLVLIFKTVNDDNLPRVPIPVLFADLQLVFVSHGIRV
jgi:hypothetical protein